MPRAVSLPKEGEDGAGSTQKEMKNRRCAAEEARQGFPPDAGTKGCATARCESRSASWGRGAGLTRRGFSGEDSFPALALLSAVEGPYNTTCHTVHSSQFSSIQLSFFADNWKT